MASTERHEFTEASRPTLPKGVRLHHDTARERWVILVPERVLVPDETAVEIVRLCDGERTVGDIVDLMARKYAADRETISADILVMLQDLSDQGFLVDRNGEIS